MAYSEAIEGLTQVILHLDVMRQISSGEDELRYRELRDYAEDALELLGGTPRVLTLDEVLTGKGCGWIENWFEPDEETGAPDYKELFECAWCYGGVVMMESGMLDHSEPEHVKKFYGKKYGTRIWTGRPTEEEREATPWLS